MKDCLTQSGHLASSEVGALPSRPTKHAMKRAVVPQASAGLSLRELDPSELRWVAGGVAAGSNAETDTRSVWLI